MVGSLEGIKQNRVYLIPTSRPSIKYMHSLMPYAFFLWPLSNRRAEKTNPSRQSRCPLLRGATRKNSFPSRAQMLCSLRGWVYRPACTGMGPPIPDPSFSSGKTCLVSLAPFKLGPTRNIPVLPAFSHLPHQAPFEKVLSASRYTPCDSLHPIYLEGR